ncbi:MAG: hypothetical protein LIO85_02505 [Rikenellaceae bacterium]|nr:hypothetical protein [Rikenellaceae bacterium]
MRKILTVIIRTIVGSFAGSWQSTGLTFSGFDKGTGSDGGRPDMVEDGWGTRRKKSIEGGVEIEPYLETLGKVIDGHGCKQG